MYVFQSFLNKFRSGEFTCAVAFGSSNTERRLSGMHWFDCFELACRTNVGRNLVCINSGWGGHTTADLLARLDRDCLRYNPDLVFITIGGNDSNPSRKISSSVFQANLLEIISRIRELGGEPILQTYYSFDLERMEPEHASSFAIRMQEIRDIAIKVNCPLIDHLSRWELLRQRYPAIYSNLMADAAHVTPDGNLLLGVDIVRHFGLKLPKVPLFREAFALQALLDELSTDCIDHGQ